MNSPVNLDTLGVRVTLDDIFQTVCDLPPDKRSAYLNEACAGDEALRREVEELVRLYETNQTFLEKPAIQDLAMEMAESGGSPSGSHKPPTELLVGKVIGNYRILSTIFVGGMGEVYLARDQKLDVDVAIKFLRREFNNEPEWQARLGQEARLQAELDHPNIVGIRYKGEFDGRPFLVFEFVPGETLKDKLDKGVLPVKEALPLFSQLAEALGYAHSKGIIHRDLKPSNLMITPTGQVKVLDFGIAKKITADLTTIDLDVGDEELTRDYGKTRKGEVMGTVAYMSPEQTRGDELDASTDVWSFGCVLYEALAGKRPFGGINAYDTLHSIRNEEPDWEALPPQTPKTLCEMLRRCLEKKPKHRPSSMAEAKQAIDRILSPRPFKAVSLRQQFGLGVVLAILLIGIFAAGVKARAWWIRTRIPAEKQFVVLPFKGFSEEQAGMGFADELRRNLLNVSDELHAAPLAIRNLSTVDLQAIQSRSGASLIVSGEVQQASDQIRIRFWVRNAYLYVLKEDEVHGPTYKLAELQNQIALRLAEKLNLKSPSSNAAFSGHLRLTHADATEQYLTALGELQQDLNKDSVEKPIEILTRLIVEEGDSARFQAALARAYLNKYAFTSEVQWTDKALEACNRAISLASDQPDIYQIVRGSINVQFGKYIEAIADFNAALGKRPRDWEAMNGLATAYSLAGEGQKAEQIYTQLLTVWPKYWESYNEAGRFYYERKNYKKALENWQIVALFLPESPTGYNNLGAAYFQSNQPAEAVSNFLLSVSKDKTQDNNEAYAGLGMVYFYQGQYQTALAYFRQGAELARQAGVQDPLLLGNVADAYRQLAGIETTPNLVDEYHRREGENYDQAIELARKNIRPGIENGQQTSLLAEWLAKRGNIQEAVSLIKSVADSDPQSVDVEVAYHATIVHLLARDFTQAFRWLEMAACNGYNLTLLERDPELQSLRADQRYQSIINKCQNTNR